MLLRLRDTFTYDHIYGTESRTRDIYDQMVDPIVNSVVEGVHGTVFAYGQTSCGKTYTMQGHGSTPGILQMAVLGIFEKIESCQDREFLLASLTPRSTVKLFEIFSILRVPC